ncbi:MAG: TonB-dependent receptor, partial [Acidobacteriota bacterium]
MMRKRFLVVSTLLVAALSALVANAQVTTATVYGSVIDGTGAPISGATVTATMEATSTSSTAMSNHLGEFTFAFLPPGRYRLTISAKGFKENTQSGVTLTAGQRLRLSYSLEVGDVSEKVLVTAEAPLIQAVSPEQQETHSSLIVKEMPLSRRDWTSLLIVGTGTNVRGSGVVLNGIGAGGFNFTIDGTKASGSSEDNSLSLFGSFNLIKGISLEAISEVNVNKGVMSAEFADTISGNVGLITKGGTNDYHGTLFWNYQGRVLNARNAFLTTRPPEVFNQFGGSAGGPIIKNKLFFFGVYEGYRQRRFTTFNANVATAAFRAQAIAAVPNYKLFFDTQPIPNQPHAANAVTGQFIGFGSNAANDNHVVGRVDYNISDRNLLNVRYTRGRPDSFQPRVSEFNPRTFGGASEVVSSSFTHSRSNFSAQTRVGVNYTRTDRSDELYQANIPLISGPGFSDGAEILNSWGTGWSVEEVLAFTRGRHSLKMGGLFQYQGQTRENIGSPSFTYSTTADFLANTPSAVSFTFGIKPYLITSWLNGYFIQDDFKIRPNLILNLGLRYDYFSVPRERDGRLFNREEPFGLGPLRPSDSLYHADHNNFAPRVGFAWMVDSKGKTVVRGGSGIFYMRHPVRNTIQLVRNAVDEPFRVGYSRAEAITYNLKYPLRNEDVIGLSKLPNAPWTDSTINPDFPDAYSIQWTLSVQRQLTSSLVFETAYVGNHALKLLFTKYINRVDRH